MTRIVAVVQARFSSQRLPGKVLRPMAGKPMLGHLFDRLRRSHTLDGVVLATSLCADDAPVAEFAAREGVQVHRGDLENVAQRMLDAATAAGADAFVRLSGDSPLLDVRVLDQAVTLFRQEKPDLVTNVAKRTFPKGQSVEVLDTAAYRAAIADFETESDREHVTPFLYRNSAHFRIVSFEHDPPCGDLQLSVDTPEDFLRAEQLLLALGANASLSSLADMLPLAAQQASAS